MRSRSIAAVLLLTCGVTWADAQEDLLFAQRLGARGMTGMALEVLDKLEKSGEPNAARAGRFGKAALTKQQATLARARFLRDLEEGRPPRVKRDEVLALYKDAQPKIEEYVTARKSDLDARFLLGELLQEYAEFLAGAVYPDDKVDERQKLVDAHAKDAEALFEQAIGHFAEVYKTLEPSIRGNVGLEDPKYIRATNAQYNMAKARLRWALLYPKGPKFQWQSDKATEELDEFLAEHFEDIFGAFAMLDLGICYYERGVRMGSADDAETAVNYFNTLYTTVEEDPGIPETITVIGQAFYWYCRACNGIARGDGALKKPQPIFYGNTVRAGAELKQRLKAGLKSPWALRAQLLVADSYASQSRFDAAVLLAGEVLSGARVAGHRTVAKQATALLTGWVANVKGAGALDAALLFQIGESLFAQGRVANAMTFYEKAIAAAGDDEEQKEKVAYPARVRIAKAYRSDKRLYAAAMVAGGVVDEFLKSGQQEDDPLGQFASDACNVARLSWRQISEATKRPTDQSQYQKVLNIFRDKFPGHPENSDAAFSDARRLFNKKDFEAAAKALNDISPTSNNYWLALRLVPESYRQLALAEQDKAKAKDWHTKCLAAAQNLVKLASAKSSEPAAKRGQQRGGLMVAMAHAALEQWPDTLRSIDRYLQAYPDQYLKKGLELKIKIDAHLALGQMDQAEAALATLRKKIPGSSYIQRSMFDTYTALRSTYKQLSGKPATDMASRAADLYSEWLKLEDDVDYKQAWFQADVLMDAARYNEAGDSYEVAANLVTSQKLKAAYRLKAAEAKYKAARDGLKSGEINRKDYLVILQETRGLFTDVLITPDEKDPQKSKQKALMDKLANASQWPSPDDFKKIKRNAQALYTAAEIYAEAGGAKGHWVAERLIFHLHSFTKPVKDPQYPKLAPLITTWWDGAELKLKVYLAIAQSGGGAHAKRAAGKGHSFAKKLIFQYQKMDGPKRVAAIKALEAQLKVQMGRN